MAREGLRSALRVNLDQWIMRFLKRLSRTHCKYQPFQLTQVKNMQVHFWIMSEMGFNPPR